MPRLESLERQDLDERKAGISLISNSRLSHFGFTTCWRSSHFCLSCASIVCIHLIVLSSVVDEESVSFRDCGQPLRIPPECCPRLTLDARTVE
jgi:hypothetical protein